MLGGFGLSLGLGLPPSQKAGTDSGTGGPFLLLADGTSKLLLANGSDRLLITGIAPGYVPTYYIYGF